MIDAWTIEETNDRLAPYGVRLDPLLYSTDCICTLADRPDCWGRFRDWTCEPAALSRWSSSRYNPEHPEAEERAWRDHAAYLRRFTER